MALRNNKKTPVINKIGSARPDGESVVAYVSFQGKIMLMPGWKKSAVRSIVVTKADGAVEVVSRECTQPGVGANLLGVCGEDDEGSDARVVPSPVASSLGHALPEAAPRSEVSPVSWGPRPPGCPPPAHLLALVDKADEGSDASVVSSLPASRSVHASPGIAPRAQVLQHPGLARVPGRSRARVLPSCAADVREGSLVLSGPRPSRWPPPSPPPFSSSLGASDAEDGSLGARGSSSGAVGHSESAACSGGVRCRKIWRRRVCSSWLARSVSSRLHMATRILKKTKRKKFPLLAAWRALERSAAASG